MNTSASPLVDRVRAALVAGDLDAFAELLDPNVTWGAPGDNTPACQNRTQVLAWYQRGRAEGRSGDVLDVVRYRDKLLVSMTVTARQSDADQSSADRWQVLTVTDGRIRDIRGYDNREDAMAAAGMNP